jgi:hypothetical protein
MVPLQAPGERALQARRSAGARVQVAVAARPLAASRAARALEVARAAVDRAPGLRVPAPQSLQPRARVDQTVQPRARVDQTVQPRARVDQAV